MERKLLCLVLFGSLSYILLINRDSEYFYEGLLLFMSAFGLDFILDEIQNLSHKQNNLNEKYLELLNIIYNIKT